LSGQGDGDATDLVTAQVCPTDGERERFVGLLREAVGTGALSVEEFESRLDAVYQAQSLIELERLVRWVKPPPATARDARPRWRRLAVIAVGVVAILAVAALLWTTTKPRPAAPTSAPSAPPGSPINSIPGPGQSSQLSGLSLPVRATNACGLLTNTEIDAVMPSSRPPARTQVGDGADECTWLSKGDGPSVVVQTGASAAQFASRFTTTDKDISGLGDQAAGDTMHPGELLARRGTLWVEVFVQNSSADGTNAKALIRAALSRL
jgi:hypothetical protein